MAHNQQPATSNQQPAQAAQAPTALQAAQAALQAALQAQGTASGPALANVLAALQSGKAYTLRQVAQVAKWQPAKRPNGKPKWQPLRRTLAQGVKQGQLVTATQGGYVGANGNPVGGKAFYMLVANG